MSKNVTWTVTLVLAAVFLWAGITKFLGVAFWTESFPRWGFPAWMRWAIGVVECLAALLLLIPRVAIVGATLGAALMFGAIVVQSSAGEFMVVPFPIVLLVLLVVLGIQRRPEMK
jgi:uncharacterized membrane protein YphA (DoxX/SURF4 family)